MEQIPAVRDLLDLRDQVALVTGGGAGIGRAIARRLSEAGAMVAVHYRTSQAGAEQIVREIEQRGGRSLAIAADLTQPEEVEQLFTRTVENLGRLDILANNAGSYPQNTLLEMTPEQWNEVIAANLDSVHLCTRAAARQMIAQGHGGAIVNIASIEAENPAPGHSHYGAAKAGVLMYTRSAANELGRFGIRVNAVAPGLIWREGIEQDWPEGVARFLDHAPLQRLGHPEDVADAVLFLVSPAARWITGASLTVDGGVMTNQVY